jgi:AmmeMemoRadiSam system protein B
VLLIGPAHYVPVRGIVAPSAARFATPLGEIPVDLEAGASLADAGLISIDDRARHPSIRSRVEMPSLQVVLGRFALIPLLVGDVTPQEVAAAIGAVMDERTLIVVSTDLSHYLNDAEANPSALTIERLDDSQPGPYDAFGYAALNGPLRAPKETGWRIARLNLRNSGDTSANRRRVVGYGAWAFFTSAQKAA